MSKCDIQIEFDRPDRTYRGGETVSGQVRLQVNQDIRCNGVTLSYYWRTHGRGNTARGEKQEFRIADTMPLQAGEILTLPFEVPTDRMPLTYHGHYINVDHYVHVGVDVPWAFDPKHEEDFLLVAGERPPEFTGERGAKVELDADAASTSRLGKIIGLVILAIVVVMLSVTFLFLIPFILVGGLVWWLRKKLIASRVGDVTLVTPHIVVAPDEDWPVELSFTPKKTFPVNGITLKIKATEVATSGSGTNSTTHRHTVFEELHTLHPQGILSAGETFSERFLVRLPDTKAWTLDESDNKLSWIAEARIDIPRFPDWAKKTELQMVPREFVGDPETPPPVPLLTLVSDTGTEEGSTSVDSDSMPGDSSTSYGESMDPLLQLIHHIESAGRFGNERSEIIEAAEGHNYRIEVIVDRVSPTFDFDGSDDRYSRGKTVLGELAGTDQSVQIYSVQDSNDLLEDLSRGEKWETVGIVTEWDSLYNRLVMRELPY